MSEEARGAAAQGRPVVESAVVEARDAAAQVGGGSGLEPRVSEAVLDDLVRRARARTSGVPVPCAPSGGRRLVVLIDGRSGSGKTTLGDALADRLGAQIVHLDDVYPGWDGLRAGSDAVVTDVLGAASGYRGWDWDTSAPAGWTPVDPSLPIVVEGCGALSRRSAPSADLRVWLQADDHERWERAIGRDGEVFAREWERWAAQEAAFIDAEHPESLADVVVRT